jgi:mannosyltransferase
MKEVIPPSMLSRGIARLALSDSPVPGSRSLKRTSHERLIIFSTILSCMTGVILISRFVLLHQSLRLDESQSFWQSSHSIRGLFHAVALDVHVPLYHLLLHFWIIYFGDGVATIRVLSLIFFLLSIPVFYVVARQLLSLRWSLFSMVLFSFSPFMNWYGNEARMYSLLVLVSLINQYFFIKILKTGKGWKWFALSALVGAYTHYFFLFVLATEGIFYLMNRKQFAPGTFKRLLIVGIMVTIALAPWLYYFHSLGSASGTRPDLARPSTVDFFNAYSQFLLGFQDDRINTIILSSWPLLMLVGLLAIRRGKAITSEQLFIATMATIPVLLAYGLSLVVTPFFLSRYLIASVPSIFILIICLLSKYKKAAALIGALLLIIATALGSIQQAVSANTPVKENYQQVVAYIDDRVQPQDLVVLSAPFTIYPFEYYYHGSAQIDTLPNWNRSSVGGIPAFNPKTLPAQVAAQNANHHYIYLVLSQDQGYEDTIRQYYLDHFKQIGHKTYSPDLTLYVYQVGYYTVPPLGQGPL